LKQLSTVFKVKLKLLKKQTQKLLQLISVVLEMKVLGFIYFYRFNDKGLTVLCAVFDMAHL